MAGVGVALVAWVDGAREAEAAVPSRILKSVRLLAVRVVALQCWDASQSRRDLPAAAATVEGSRSRVYWRQLSELAAANSLEYAHLFLAEAGEVLGGPKLLGWHWPGAM